jgi:fumarate reductase flavoprotein subunit
MAWWDEEFDVVVMGAGGAGLMAAVEAAERGASVLLVEKQQAPGGSATGMSVGSITAAGTDLQKAAGIHDSVDAHYQTVVEMAAMYPQWKWDLGMSRLMCEHSPLAVARLSELGVNFSGPHPEVPHPVYRMHNAVPGSEAYIDALTRAVSERGVQLRVETTVDELQRDEDGNVSLAAVRHVRSSQTRAVHVRKALILAAGDFSASAELGKR